MSVRKRISSAFETIRIILALVAIELFLALPAGRRPQLSDAAWTRIIALGWLSVAAFSAVSDAAP